MFWYNMSCITQCSTALVHCKFDISSRFRPLQRVDIDTKFKCSKGRDYSNVTQFHENILQGQFLFVLACECQIMLAFSVKQTHSKSIHVLWNDSKHTDSCQTIDVKNVGDKIKNVEKRRFFQNNKK